MMISKIKNIFWHICKALICSLQLLFLYHVARISMDEYLRALIESEDLQSSLMVPIVVTAMFIALWWYYDRIDDLSFNRFCDTDKPTKLLREPGFLTELVLTVVCASPILARAWLGPLQYSPLPHGGRIAVAFSGSLLLVTAVSLIRITRLNNLWAVQKTLRDGKEKRYGPIKRVIYALIYFIALYALTFVGITIFLPVVESLLKTAYFLLRIPLLVLLILLAVLEVLHDIRRVLERRKFLRRLEKLQEQGVLTYELHGRPYASLFGYSIPFGMIVTHHPRPDSQISSDTTYRVAIANCHRRRFAIVLCENQILQFMYSINIRIFRNMSGGIGMMRAGGVGAAGVRGFTMPAMSWFVSHSFVFPEGDGGRSILLVDPAPHTLLLRGNRQGEFLTLDNGAEIFGYTVYGKNAFLNVMERT